MITMDGHESPIEDIFAHEIRKFLRTDLTLDPQFEATTSGGTFRFDFVIEDGARRYVFECDGQDFHDSFRDEVRDAFTLGDGVAKVVYRLPGSAIYGHISACLFYIAMWDPSLFEDRAIEVLRRAAANEGGGVLPEYHEQGGEMSPGVGVHGHCVRRRSTDPTRQRQPWRRHYAFAKSHGGTLDAVVTALNARPDPLSNHPRR